MGMVASAMRCHTILGTAHCHSFEWCTCPVSLQRCSHTPGSNHGTTQQAVSPLDTMHRDAADTRACKASTSPLYDKKLHLPKTTRQQLLHPLAATASLSAVVRGMMVLVVAQLQAAQDRAHSTQPWQVVCCHHLCIAATPYTRQGVTRQLYGCAAYHGAAHHVAQPACTATSESSGKHLGPHLQQEDCQGAAHGAAAHSEYMQQRMSRDVQLHMPRHRTAQSSTRQHDAAHLTTLATSGNR